MFKNQWIGLLAILGISGVGAGTLIPIIEEVRYTNLEVFCIWLFMSAGSAFLTMCWYESGMAVAGFQDRPRRLERMGRIYHGRTN